MSTHKTYETFDDWYAGMTRKSKAQVRREKTAANKTTRADKKEAHSQDWNTRHAYKNYGLYGVKPNTPISQVKGKTEYFITAQDRRSNVVGNAVAVGYNRMREARSTIYHDRHPRIWIKFHMTRKRIKGV